MQSERERGEEGCRKEGGEKRRNNTTKRIIMGDERRKRKDWRKEAGKMMK